MLTSTIELVRHAQNARVAVGAFNTYTIEQTQAIIQAAERLQCPVILQLGVPSLKVSGEPLVQALLAAARNASVPVSVHLDHCSDLQLIETCLRWGFSSALADGSRLPWQENVVFTRKAVELAQGYGATIEAELGYLAGTEDGITIEQLEASLTDPAQARSFIQETGAALLAVSIGNVHGYTPEPPPLDFERLALIAKLVDVPLVLHGASGLPVSNVQQSIRMGIAKLNVNTEVRSAFLSAIAQWGMRHGPEPDVRRKGQDLLDLMREASTAAGVVVEATLKTCNFL
jgi:tagatose 1,6-diphosphate aldolase GatY/KbaY